MKTSVARRQHVQRELAKGNIIERNQCRSGSIVEVVLRVLTLLTNTECKVEVVSNDHEGSTASNLHNLTKAFIPKLLDVQ